MSLAQSLIVRVPILLLFFMLRVMRVTTAATTSGTMVMIVSLKVMLFFMASPWHNIATF
jgi:L-lactate permease